MDSRSIHSSRGGGHGGNGGMPGIPGMGIQQTPGGPGGPPHPPPPHHHLPPHHGPPPSGPHYDDRDRMSAHSGRLHRPSPPLADSYYALHHQQPPPHHNHQQHHQQHPSHHQQHPQPPHHAQHTHQPPPHHGPHPAHGIQQPTRHYKEHSRSPEAERIPQSYRSQAQQRNESLTPLNIASRSPVGPPPSMYPVPRASTPDQQHPSSRAPSLTGSPAVYRPPSHHPPPPPSHAPHHPHPHPPHHQMGPESMMNPPPPHHRSMLPPSSPHRNTPPLQQQPPPPPPPQHQGPHQKQGRQPTPSSNHPGPSTPFPGSRDLPSLNNAAPAPPPPPPPPRQTSGMSISAMLDGPAQPSQTGPPKPPPPQPDYNPSKRPYTPDYGHQNGDRSRNVSIGSSPGVMSNQHQGYGPTGAKGRATPDTYRSNLPHAPPGIMANHPHVPPRPVSQPVAPSTPHSLSSVFRPHQDEGPHRGHARSASYHDRESMRERERERESARERERERERYEHEMFERERYEREMEKERSIQREREMREREMREMREREMREREREMREREMREREIREREMREREMREREMREREMREREREMREREMREREMREREMRERERERERELREREVREREIRDREMREREMERDRERDREQQRLGTMHMGPSSPHVNHHPQPHGPPPYHTHPSMTSAVPPPQLPPPPPGQPHTPMVSGIATLPPQQPLNANHGPPPPPPQTSSSYPSFGYTTVMPPSPFALQPTPSLPPPPPGESHDRRRQGYADNQHGRAEELLYSKQMSERKAAAQSVAQAQIDRKNPLLAMGGYDMDGIGGQAVSKRGISEKEEKEDNIGGTRGRTKEKMEKERETEEEGPPSVVSAGPGKKRRHVHHHHHPPHHHPHHHHPHPHHSHDNDERFPLDGGPLHPQSQSTAQTSGKRAMTPIPVHHHYPPRHHSPAPQPPAKRPKLIINSTPVVASVANFPRYHLGSMVYNPSGNVNASNKGYSTTHSMLPRFEGRENCIFQIRIPRRYLYERERAEICRKRSLWGSDVYTDDSDVLAVLIHLGKIPPSLPEGVEPEMVLGSPAGAIEERDKEIGRKAGRIGGKGKAVVNGAWHNSAPATTSTDKINGATSNPASGATINSGYLDINKDIIVDILILPPLEKYSSTVRNAIRSRSWTSQHDGMSYMVHEVKTAEPGEAEGRGKSMRKQRLNEREYIRKWGTLPGREGEGGLRSLVGREAKVGA